jgi:tetratricopeptide (TPR) repeat protein
MDMKNNLRWMVRLACCSPLLGGCATLSTPESGMLATRAEVSRSDPAAEAEGAYQLGRYHQGQNRLDDAIVAFKRSLRFDPRMVEARNALGVAYAMQGRRSDAITELRTAAEQAPGAAHIRSNLGYALYLNGSYEEAVVVLERSIALDPNNVRAHSNLTLAYKAIGAGSATTPTADGLVAAAAGSGVQSGRAPAEPPPLAAVRPNVSVSPLLLPPPSARLIELTANVYEIRVTPAAQALAAAAAMPGPIAIEVSNGNGVRHLARTVAHYLDGPNYRALHRTNWTSFAFPVSRVDYREGYRTQARELSELLPGSPPVMLTESMRSDVNLRIVLGKDLVKQVAAFRGKRAPTLIARAAMIERQPSWK